MYNPQAWYDFLVYQTVTTLVLVYNIYLLQRTMWVHDLACESACGCVVAVEKSLTSRTNSLRID